MDTKKFVPHSHGHLWMIGLVGVAAGLTLMVYVPTMPAVSNTLLLLGGFHLAGAVILLGSVAMMIGGSRVKGLLAWRRETDGEQIDYGWATAWSYGPWLACLTLLSAAAALQVAAPAYWPLAFAATLLAANLFAGGLAARSVGLDDHAVLPMVPLLAPGQAEGTVLDAGCGSGRTTLAVGRSFRNANIVSVDRFDSDYIEGGGKALIERNARLAGLSARVRIQAGDLTCLPFDDAHFDAAVSAHAIDHLGPQKETGLREVCRVLKPGSRFLLVVWVPGWTMFSIVTVIAFLFSPKSAWRRMAVSAGFELESEGMFNGNWFAVLKKPD